MRSYYMYNIYFHLHFYSEAAVKCLLFTFMLCLRASALGGIDSAICLTGLQ